MERSADLEEWETWREVVFDGAGRVVLVVAGEVGVGRAKFYRIRLSAVGEGS